MTKIEVITLLKKRILAQRLNIKIFITSYISIIFIGLFIINSFIIVMLSIIVFPLIFFVVIPYILQGYTLGGWLVRIQIVHIQVDIKKISLKLFLEKTIEEFKFFFRFRKERYSIYSNYPTVKFYLINSRGQFPFDEKLNLTVKSKENFILNNNKIEYYEIEDLKRNFDIEGKKFFFIVQNILYIIWFIVISFFYCFSIV